VRVRSDDSAQCALCRRKNVLGDKDVDPSKGITHSSKSREVTGVAVGLAESGHARLRFDFDDGAQSEGLVYTHRVEQWWIVKGHGRDNDIRYCDGVQDRHLRVALRFCGSSPVNGRLTHDLFFTPRRGGCEKEPRR
jgi:hypothetical protein